MRQSTLSADRLAILFGAIFLSTAASADITTRTSVNPVGGGEFGDSVAIVPDQNGDQCPDILISAPDETGAGVAESGRVYVISGKTGYELWSHVSPNPEVVGWYGEVVLGLPDINGDGRGDYLIAAPNQGGSTEGDLYVYSGATHSLIYHLDGWSYRSFGAIDLVPDCTGDGLPELVIGYSGPGDYTSVRVYQAKNGALWKTLTSPIPSGDDSSFGVAVAGVADVTGDGKGDVIVGAPEASPGAAPTGAGRVYVYNGATGALYDTITSIDEQANGEFGASVAGCGDLNGDGRGEIIVGAPNETPDRVALNAGQVHIHSGLNGNFIRTLFSTDPEANGNFGGTVRGCGDLNDDGKADVVVGAEFEDVSATEYGRVYRFSGASGDLIEMLTAPGSTAERFGHAIDASQDVNKDGKPDLVVGAPSTDSGGFAAAGAAVIYREIDNDGCSGVLGGTVTVTNGVWPITTIGATTTGADVPSCGFFGTSEVSNDVFFTYVATCTDILTVSTCSTVNFDSRIVVYGGCSFSFPSLACSLGNPIACNDGAVGCTSLSSKVEVPVVEGQCYRIRIGTYGEEPDFEGWGTVKIQCGPGEPSDINGDFMVDAADLGVLLGGWGGFGAGDLDNDGTVGGSDLAIMLGAWGPVG